MQILCNKKMVELIMISTPILPPTNCIVCKSELVKDGVNYCCVNEECEGVATRKINSWITKRNIKFIGDSLLIELFENHGIKTPQDLYTLTYDKLAAVPRGAGVVGTGARHIMAEIEKSKSCSVSDLFGSVCIKFLGRRQVEIILDVSKGRYKTPQDFLSLTVDDLLALPGFKSSKAEGIVNGIRKARPTIEALLKILTIEDESTAVQPQTGETDMDLTAKRRIFLDKRQITIPVTKPDGFKGKVFCFTGKVERTDEHGERYTREMLWDFTLLNNGNYTEKVMGNTTHLVQADPSSTSSKTKKAQSLGIKIISEKEFFDMVS